MIWRKAFWKGAGERAVKTWIQTFTAVFGVQTGVALSGADFVALPWETSTITASVAAVLSLLMAIGNADFTAGTTEDNPPAM